jgi:tetratricopeptide (TPR) repeat protein
VQVGYDHVNLGILLNRKREYAQAEAEFREALRIYAAALPPGHVYIGSALTGLAQALIELGKPEEGYAAARRALEIWRNNLPDGDSHISRAQEIMARAKVTATAKLTAATK